jgi:RNA polymerase sigma factor (sigma-70 family)
MRGVKQLPTFEVRHEGSFEAYLRRAFLNRVRDEIRRRMRQLNYPDHAYPVPTAPPSPLEEAIRQEDRVRYEAALRTLRPADRELIVARMELHLDYEEIARRLGKPSGGAARVAIARALGRLAQRIRKNRRGRPEI